MNALFVTYDFPFPTTSGGKNRAYNLLKHTAKEANVFLYSFVRADFNPDFCQEILALNVKDIKVFKRRKVKDFRNLPKFFTNNSIFKTLYYEKKVERELLDIIKNEKIDVVHFESSYTGFYIGKKLKKSGVKQVLGTENIEFQLYFDYAKLQKIYKRPFISYESYLLKREEISMFRKADVVTTVTREERDAVLSLSNKKSEIVANGIDPGLYTFDFQKKVKNNILFVGNFSYFPNIDAVNFLTKKIFPKLNNNITLTIIGKDASKKFKFSETRIILKDYVEDIISEYRNADALVFPIRVGGGTNFKILEAMSLGLPIVANPDRLTGLEVNENEDFLKALTPEEYVFQIEKLYSDRMLSEKLAKNARAVIEKYYTWDLIGHDLLKVWKEIV